MLREEAKMILEEVKIMDDSMYQYNTKYLEALDMAIEALNQLTSYEQTINKLTKAISEQEPKTGHWEWVQYDANPEIGNFHCSECRYMPASFNMSAQKLNYCPNCGARMESAEC